MELCLEKLKIQAIQYDQDSSQVLVFSVDRKISEHIYKKKDHKDFLLFGNTLDYI